VKTILGTGQLGFTKKTIMKSEKLTGIMLILGVIGVFIPYTILTITFNYPDVLREEAGIILTKFHQGGTALIFTWFAFAILGFPFIIAYQGIGQKLESKFPFLKWVTTIGIISVIVQMIGLLRWVFVVPELANDYVSGNEMTRIASEISFKTIHQFGGVLLGEHLGQLFTIVWTIMICSAFWQLKILPKWISLFGIFASLIYLLAQMELITTVIPNFPNIEWAGFIGSTLWLIWLIILGIRFMHFQINLRLS